MIRKFTTTVAVALLMGFGIGCTESAVEATGSSDSYAMYAVNSAAMNDFSEIPSADEVFAKEGDPTRGEKERGDKGWGKLDLRSYERIIRQLQLSERQAAAVRECFAAYRECATSSAARYRNARGEANDALRSGTARVRAAVEGGTLSREDAAAALATLNREYRQAVGNLNDAFNAATEACKTSLDTCIESILTPEQLVRWNRLKR